MCCILNLDLEYKTLLTSNRKIARVNICDHQITSKNNAPSMPQKESNLTIFWFQKKPNTITIHYHAITIELNIQQT